MGNICCCQQSEQKSTIISNKHAVQSDKTQKPKQQNTIVKNSNQSKHKITNATQKYNSLKFIGRGTFGDVVQVEQKKTLKKYAMKIIKKSNMKQFNLLQCQLIQEISVKPQFVSIHEIFENQERVYIVMEYLSRGDIYFYNKKKIIKFQEKLIRQILAEIIVGIGIMHSYGIIYRQLKPQNLLLTDQGHIKLNDYGLSKMIKGKDQTHTYVGPMEYSAPEVIRDNYGQKVDVWAIGILMYELRFRDTPFSSVQNNNESPNNTPPYIDNSKIKLQQILQLKKKQVSQQFYDVLCSCLKQDPQERINLDQLKKKPFFASVNWEQVEELRNPPPFAEFNNEDYKFRDPDSKEIQPDRKVISNYSNNYQTSIHSFTNHSEDKTIEPEH